MTHDHNQFISKLNELEFEYRQMIDRIRSCHQGTHEEIAQVQESLVNECREYETRLSEAAVSGRSKAVRELSAVHLGYFRDIRTEWEEKIPQYLNTTDKPEDACRAEAMALYAEFAIDNAIQAIRYAMYAAFSTVDMQRKADEAAEH